MMLIIEDRKEFFSLFQVMVENGIMLPSQKDSLEKLWQAAWDLGSAVGYDLGYDDGILHEQNENRVSKPTPGAPINLDSETYVVGL